MTDHITQPIVLIIGLIASVLMVIAGLTTHRRKLFTFNATISLLSVSQYFLLGTWSALAIAAIGVTRNVMLAGFEHKYPQVNTYKTAIFFAGLHTLVFTLITQFPVNHLSWYEFLPLIGALFGTFASFWKHMVIIKTFMIISGINWLTFEIVKGAYGQALGESLTMIANFAAIAYLILQHRKLGANISDDEIEDLSTQVINIVTTPIKIPDTFTQPVKTHTSSHTTPIKIS